MEFAPYNLALGKRAQFCWSLRYGALALGDGKPHVPLDMIRETA